MLQSSDYVLDPTDVLAHVFFAAGTIDKVQVSSEMGEFTGSFRLPQSEGVEIVHGDAYVPLEPGSPIYVDYDGPGDKYRFYASVLAVGQGVVRVSLPEAIECTERRLSPRIPLSSKSGVEFHALGVHGTVPCKAVDLSNGGVGWLDDTGWDLQEGQIVYGDLHLGSKITLSVGVEVRHSRELGDGRVTGGRFASISLADRAQLAHFLISLLRRN